MDITAFLDVDYEEIKTIVPSPKAPEEKDYRVFFVSGVAGIGKSVLCKRLAFEWAKDEIFQYQCLIYFECRVFNEYFVNKKGSIVDVLDEFLKDRFFGFTSHHDENTLFLIDGLDEMLNAQSVMDKFINSFPVSKFVLFGRPHFSIDLPFKKIEFPSVKDVGDDKMKDYLKKAWKIVGYGNNKIKDAIKVYARDIKLFPQLFSHVSLNYFYALRENLAMPSKTDLYTWTLYMLLRDHSYLKKDFKERIEESSITHEDNRIADSSKTQLKSDTLDIFSVYSKQLKSISKLAYDWCIGRKVSVTEVDSFFTEIDKSKEGFKNFFRSLLLPHNDRNGRLIKYKFKHKAIKEFLAAIHVCFGEDGERLITDMVTKRHKENFPVNVLSFICNISRYNLLENDPSDLDIVHQMIQRLDVKSVHSEEPIFTILNNFRKSALSEKDLQIIIEVIANSFKSNEKLKDRYQLIGVLSKIRVSSAGRIDFKIDERQTMHLSNLIQLSEGNGINASQLKSVFAKTKWIIKQNSKRDRVLNKFLDMVSYFYFRIRE
eukprot:gene19554-21486_t